MDRLHRNDFSIGRGKNRPRLLGAQSLRISKELENEERKDSKQECERNDVKKK